MKKTLTAIFVLMLSHIALYAQHNNNTATKGNTAYSKYNSPADSLRAIRDAKYEKAHARYDSISRAGLAQEIKRYNYVFEGTVMEAQYFRDGQRQTALIIKIHKIFKGSLTCGTVEAIGEGGWQPSKFDSSATLREGFGSMTKGMSGIFLCSTNTIKHTPATINKPDNPIILQVQNLIQYDPVDYSINYESAHWSLYKQIYAFLLQATSTKIESCDSMDFQKHRNSLVIVHHYKLEHGYYPSDTLKNKKPTENNPPIKQIPNSKGPNNQWDDVPYPSYYNIKNNNMRGPNNEGNDAFFLPEPEFLPEPPPAPVPMSFTSDGLLYWLNIISVDSTNKAVNFDIEVENENGDDTFYLASATIYTNY